jgi:ppGpp synthetase/RelA/SpoT-type nucleotidyltranferase
MSVIAEARTRFIDERPQFEALARRVEGEIRALVRARGFDCQVSGRAKDVASFVGKCICKGYSHPWEQVTDKVGVRITVGDPRSIASIVALLPDQYEVLSVEDKSVALRKDEKIGYSGVHVQVRVAADTATVGGECEIQVRTAAQNLWSEMSHKLLYKPGVEPRRGDSAGAAAPRGAHGNFR